MHRIERTAGLVGLAEADDSLPVERTSSEPVAPPRVAVQRRLRPAAPRRGLLRILSDVPIRSKLVLMPVLASGVSLVLAEVGFVSFELATARQTMLGMLSTTGQVIAANAKTPLALGDADAANVMLAALSAEQGVRYACLFTDHGERFAAYFRPDVPPECAPWLEGGGHGAETHGFEMTEVVWATPLVFQGRPLGSLVLRAETLDPVEQATRYGAIAGGVMVVSVLVAFLMASWLQRVISVPILHLVSAAEYVSAHQDYSVRAARLGKDEIGLLIDAFNHMLRQIQGRDREVARQRDQLDREVRARTAELVQREKAEERIRYLAYYDVLTDLPNRQSLRERLDQTLAEPRAPDEQVAVLFLDLDRFKEINDTFGHGEGDHLLRIVAKRLLKCVRESDCVARAPDGRPGYAVSRQGGDEFTVMLTRMHSREDVGRVAQRILEALAEPMQLGGRDVVVGTSIGIAMSPEHGTGAEALLKHADMAMYAAKHSGRNHHEWFSESMQVAALRKVTLEADLRKALEWGEFRLHYQPKIDLRSGAVVGLEALVRWVHPERGIVSPGEFITLAEELGLITTLGEWVLRTACEQLRTWLDDGFPPVQVAVNVSSLQFRDERLLARVPEILEETGIPPELVELEITESAMIQNEEAAVRMLDTLRGLGLKVALDDFGTGYSSLNYVGRLPLDSLKIDSSFVRELASNHESGSIVTAVIAMAHSLALQVVAEGVETYEQVRLLRDLGCDQLQGYLFSTPLPAHEVEALLGSTFDLSVVDRAEPASEPAGGGIVRAYPLEPLTH